MLIHCSVKLFRLVSYAHSFYHCECIDGDCVLRLEVGRVVLHTLPFLRFNVLLDRRMMVYDGGCCGNDTDACVTRKFLRFVRWVEDPDVEFLVRLDLSNTVCQSA